MTTLDTMTRKGPTTSVSRSTGRRTSAGVEKTIWRIIKKVIEEMQTWRSWSLENVDSAIFGETLTGEKGLFGLRASTEDEDATLWSSVLTDLKNRGTTDSFIPVL